MQDQRIAGICLMTSIGRDFHYLIQYQPRIIVTVQYHDNGETLFLTHIDRRFLYYFLDERFRSRHNWLKAYYDNRTEIFCKTDNPCIIRWHTFFQIAVISLWSNIKQVVILEIYATDNIKIGRNRGGRDRMVYLQLPVQSVPISTKVINSNPARYNFMW
jgi:hypothetical protein